MFEHSLKLFLVSFSKFLSDSLLSPVSFIFAHVLPSVYPAILVLSVISLFCTLCFWTISGSWLQILALIVSQGSFIYMAQYHKSQVCLVHDGKKTRSSMGCWSFFFKSLKPAYLYVSLKSSADITLCS